MLLLLFSPKQATLQAGPTNLALNLASSLTSVPIYTKEISAQQYLQKKIFTERLNLKISNTGKVHRLGINALCLVKYEFY